MYYRPIFLRQLADRFTIWDSFICVFSSGGMALDFHTRGKIRKTGGQLLAKIGLPSYEIKDGSNLRELQRAWLKFGYYLQIRTGIGTWSTLVADRKAGRGIVLQGDHDQLSYAERCSTFMGDHAVYLNPDITGSYQLMGNPLCYGWKWGYDPRLRSYAEDLGRRGGLGRAANGQQKIFYAVTMARPIPIPKITTAYGTPAYSMTAKGLKELWLRRADGRLVRHRATNSFNFSAQTTKNLQKMTVGSGSATSTFRRITNGSHAGAYIHMVSNDPTTTFRPL